MVVMTLRGMLGPTGRCDRGGVPCPKRGAGQKLAGRRRGRPLITVWSDPLDCGCLALLSVVFAPLLDIEPLRSSWLRMVVLWMGCP